MDDEQECYYNINPSCLLPFADHGSLCAEKRLAVKAETEKTWHAIVQC